MFILLMSLHVMHHENLSNKFSIDSDSSSFGRIYLVSLMISENQSTLAVNG